MFKEMFNRRKLNKIKKQVRVLDWIMLITFLFMLATRIMTISYFQMVSEETGVNIEKIATAYEQSPVTALLINLRKIGGIFVTLLLPGMAMAMYYMFRRSTLKGRMDIRDLSYMVSLMFFIFLINVINDAAYYVSKLIT